MLFSNYFMTIIYVFICLSSIFVFFEIIKLTIIKKRKKNKSKSNNFLIHKNNIIEINHELDSRAITRVENKTSRKEYPEIKCSNILNLDTEITSEKLELIRLDEVETNFENQIKTIKTNDCGKGIKQTKKISGNNIDTINYENGNIYKGEIVNGKRSGFGELICNENEKYEGLWKDDLMHGIGKYIYSDGTVYTGEFKFGKKNGLGKFVYPNNEIFKGFFLEDKKNGKGIVYTQEGTKEVGVWNKGEKIHDIDIDEFDKNRNNYKIYNNNNNF